MAVLGRSESRGSAVLRGTGVSPLTTDLKDRRIRVNALGPGHIDTEIGKTAGLSREENDAYFERTAFDTPLGRNGLADDIAAAALYLACDDSAFVTGIQLLVDGGYAQI